jgi:hypothetical protein
MSWKQVRPAKPIPTSTERLACQFRALRHNPLTFSSADHKIVRCVDPHLADSFIGSTERSHQLMGRVCLTLRKTEKGGLLGTAQKKWRSA